MTDLSDFGLESELGRARGAVPSWSMARQQQVIWGVKGRLLASRRRTSMFVVAAAALLSVGIGWAAFRQYTKPSPAVASIGAERWNLRDGSQIVIESPATIIKKQRESESEILFELEAGTAKFDVARRPARVFRVNAGDVTVEVVGTSFLVARQQDRSRVSVSHGKVVVSWRGGSRELGKGESGTFPPEALAVSEAPAPAPANDVMPLVRAQEERTGAEALFANADKARKEGRPELAAGILKTITERYPSDPRAPLAAFTRGRVLLESLNRPRDAALSFARARNLAGRGSALAEDALAREVEAHAASGETGLARERAELYRRSYPKGLRLQQVIRRGGLQDAP